MRSFLTSVSGLVVGIALTVIAFLANWIPWPEPRRPLPWDETGYVAYARVAQPGFDIPPRIDIEHGVALDPEGAMDVGTSNESADDMRFGCESIETNSDVRAFLLWRGDGYRGDAVVLRFGPNREDVSVRVGSNGHMGYQKTWDHPRSSIRLSDWPVDRPGTIVAFEIAGELEDKVHEFDGKFRIPLGVGDESLSAPTSHESSDVDSGAAEEVFERRIRVRDAESSNVRVLIDEQPDTTPVPYVTPTAENEYTARVERIPASPGVLALRYTESDMKFVGISATFSLGPADGDVRVRIDDFGCGGTESWTNLEGTMWVSSKSLDREGVVVELELFGTHSGERRRFHARFLTPP